jgi:plastocyanin
MSALSLVSMPTRRRATARMAAMGLALTVSVAALAGCGATATKTSSTKSSSAAKTSSSTSKTSSSTSKTSSSSSKASATSKTSSSTSKTSSATSKTSSTTSATLTAAQLAKYYKAKGAPVTLTSGKALNVAVNDFYFNPNTYTVTPGAQVVLNLKNASSLQHTFTFTPAKINVVIPANGSATAKFTAPSKAGTYYFYCAVPGHAALGMVGKITVK